MSDKLSLADVKANQRIGLRTGRTFCPPFVIDAKENAADSFGRGRSFSAGGHSPRDNSPTARYNLIS